MDSGKIELTQLAILVVSGVAAATDLARARIPNVLTVPALGAGVAYHAANGGLPGALGALAGAGVGLLLFVWLFWLGAMGGGDVKLLAALGAWMGARPVFDLALLSILVGGIMGVFLLAWKGTVRDFARRMWEFVLSLLVRELERHAPKLDRKHKMPFGVAIAIAVVWQTFWGSPIAAWIGGVR